MFLPAGMDMWLASLTTMNQKTFQHMSRLYSFTRSIINKVLLPILVIDLILNTLSITRTSAAWFFNPRNSHYATSSIGRRNMSHHDPTEGLPEIEFIPSDDEDDDKYGEHSWLAALAEIVGSDEELRSLGTDAEAETGALVGRLVPIPSSIEEQREEEEEVRNDVGHVDDGEFDFTEEELAYPFDGYDDSDDDGEDGDDDDDEPADSGHEDAMDDDDRGGEPRESQGAVGWL